MKIAYKDWTFQSAQTESAEPVCEQSLSCESISANVLTATVRCNEKAIMDFQLNDPVKFWADGTEASKQTYYLQSVTRTGSLS